MRCRGQKVLADLQAAPGQEISRMYRHLYPDWVGESSALPGTVTDSAGAMVPGRCVRSNLRIGVWLAKAPLAKDPV